MAMDCYSIVRVFEAHRCRRFLPLLRTFTNQPFSTPTQICPKSVAIENKNLNTGTQYAVSVVS